MVLKIILQHLTITLTNKLDFNRNLNNNRGTLGKHYEQKQKLLRTHIK